MFELILKFVYIALSGCGIVTLLMSWEFVFGLLERRFNWIKKSVIMLFGEDILEEE